MKTFTYLRVNFAHERFEYAKSQSTATLTDAGGVLVNR